MWLGHISRAIGRPGVKRYGGRARRLKHMVRVALVLAVIDFPVGTQSNLAY
jgi:hypothetical protein